MGGAPARINLARDPGFRSNREIGVEVSLTSHLKIWLRSNRGLYNLTVKSKTRAIVKLFQFLGWSFFGATAARRGVRRVFARLVLPANGGLVVVIFILDNVLHDERDAPVRRVERIVSLAQPLIGKTADLRSPGRSGFHYSCIRRRAALARSLESSQFP